MRGGKEERILSSGALWNCLAVWSPVLYDTGVKGVGTAWGTGFGIGVALNFGRLGSPTGWGGGEARVGALICAGVKRGVGAKGAGGGEVMSE